jgi:formylglycine-generating enzyme required for sulfatase activity
VSIRNLLSEWPPSRKILIMALGAVLIVAAVTVTGYFTYSIYLKPKPPLRETTSVDATKPDDVASSANRSAPGMVYIPGGKFIMGYNDSDQPAEKPEHEVTVAPFLMDQYEVTVEDYYKFIKAKNHGLPKEWPASWGEGKFKAEEAKLPVTNITWFDARDYAESLGKRLPTEEEWEYAARGTDKRLYPWGNDLNPNYANIGDPEKKAIKPVGSFQKDKSQFGVFDMAGNVLEWTGSDWSLYPGSRVRPKPGKMVRGGSYLREKVFAMVTSRGILRSEAQEEDVGFRCAKNVAKQ